MKKKLAQVTQQKLELEGRLSSSCGRAEDSRIVKEAARENVAVIPISGREVDATRLTISVNTSPREAESDTKRKGVLSRRGSPPAGPASLPAISSSGSVNSGKSGKKEVQVFQLEQHCKNLEDQLDEVRYSITSKDWSSLTFKVKYEIVKILSDKADFSKENAVLKNYQQVQIIIKLKLKFNHIMKPGYNGENYHKIGRMMAKIIMKVIALG